MLWIKENACELLFTALVTKRTARAEELYTDELDTYIRQYKDCLLYTSFAACSDDDEEESTPTTENIVGQWVLTYEEGYEICLLYTSRCV